MSLADTCMRALSSVLVVDMSSIAAWMSYQLATLARHWTRANVFSSSMAKVQCSATWFLVATGFLEALTQQHQQQNNLPHTRSEVSAKRRLCQLSTLPRRHSSLIWPLAKMETLKRMVLSPAWCPFFGTVDCCDLDCFTNVLARHWTRAFQCSATWFLVGTRFLEAVTQQHQQQNNLPHTRSEVSPKCRLCQLSTLPRSYSSLIWPFAKWKLWRE